jgi:hypothetical protein
MKFKHLALGALLSAALAFAACGGDDDDSSEPSDGGNGNTTPTEAPTNGGDDGNDDDNGADGDGDNNSAGGVEENRAVVVIGDRTYDFDISIQCLSMFGNMAAAGRALDGSDISVNIQLPPEDWETDTDEEWDPPSIRVSDDVNDLDWRAGDEIIGEMVDEGSSQVDSFTHDGKRASGTATFVDLYAVMRGETDPVQGSFEFTCPD